MFYSHEILTSRKGGVATVWLVATIGSKSNLKKVNRKAILDVNVPATCRIIIEPEAPMALRLQSNLLYGVSRVFSQQCGYILSDAESFQANMRAFVRAIKTSELDPNAGKARRDQLVLEDDPAFLPDFALPGLDIDLAALDISTDASSRRSSILSPHSQLSSQSSHAGADESALGLIIPTSDTGGAGDLGGFVLPEGSFSSAQRRAQFGRLLDDEDEGFNVDPGFTFDAEGNLIEERTPGPGQGVAPTEAIRFGSDSAANDNVRQQLLGDSEAGQYERDLMDLGPDIPRFDNEDILLPDAEPFPEMAPGGASLPQPPSRGAAEEESTDSGEAPLRRKRREPKLLLIDQRMELHNADLARWKTDYIEHMAEAKEAKRQQKATALAKKNAAFWVIGSGIGGVGAGLGSSKMKSPLDMFAGDALMEALTGIRVPTAGQKRSREDDEIHDSDSETRRVRPRAEEEDQVGRGEGVMLNDEGTMMSEGVEVGRHAQPSLEDPTMPWNLSSALGSRQGSTIRGRGFTGSIGGFPSSAGGPGSLPGVGGPRPGSLDRRGSRLPSASPLVGRGIPRYSSIDLPIGNDGDEDPFGGRPRSDNQALDDNFQLYGPGAAVDTQTAADSQWVRSTLNQEANNFLTFVQTKIGEIPAVEGDEDELFGDGRPGMSVTFEALLPPAQNTKVVASQALYHVLALATKGLLSVEQNLPDESIDLSIPPGV